MKRFALLLFGLGLALGWAGWLGAIRDPAVVHYRVELAGLQRPLRLIHLSDLHGSNWDMPQMRLNRIMDQVNALHPDLVVVTGDFHASKIWDPPMRMDDAVQPLTRLKAPLGMWSVPGNHDDPYWIRWVMRRFGLKLLAGDLVDLGPIQIVGSDDLIIGQMDKFSVLGVHYARRRKVMDRFTQSAGSVAERLLLKLWQRGEKPLL